MHSSYSRSFLEVSSSSFDVLILVGIVLHEVSLDVVVSSLKITRLSDCVRSKIYAVTLSAPPVVTGPQRDPETLSLPALPYDYVPLPRVPQRLPQCAAARTHDLHRLIKHDLLA